MLQPVAKIDGDGGVDLRPPRPAAGPEPAGWLTERIDLRGPHWVTNLLGSGFAAYARMFHPAQDHLRAVTWAEVARANGRKMHPWAQWHQINSPAEPSLARNPCAITRGPHLDTEALEALCAILARHTATAWSCYFALWEGRTPGRTASVTFTAVYAPDGVLPSDIKLPAPAPRELHLDLSGPTFLVPGHNTPRGSPHYLFEGHVSAATRIGSWVHESFFIPQPPDFIWPGDHTWCVAATHANSTLIGGSSELVDELCAAETIEVLPIPPTAPFDLNPSEDPFNL
jgi:hypothetical protein